MEFMNSSQLSECQVISKYYMTCWDKIISTEYYKFSDKAYAWFDENKSFYHPVVVEAITKILAKYPPKLME